MQWSVRLNSLPLHVERCVHLVLFVEHLLNVLLLFTLDGLSVFQFNFEVVCNLLSVLLTIHSLDGNGVLDVGVAVPVGALSRNIGLLVDSLWHLLLVDHLLRNNILDFLRNSNILHSGGWDCHILNSLLDPLDWCVFDSLLNSLLSWSILLVRSHASASSL